MTENFIKSSYVVSIKYYSKFDDSFEYIAESAPLHIKRIKLVSGSYIIMLIFFRSLENSILNKILKTLSFPKTSKVIVSDVLSKKL